jgi:uncharacterized protein
MENVQEKIADIDWQQTVIEEINERGYALVSRFLPAQYCDELIGKYDDSDLYRNTITMERHSLTCPLAEVSMFSSYTTTAVL